LEAVNYRKGTPDGSCELHTADKQVELDVDVDQKILKADGTDLAYLTVSLVDAEGNRNLQEVKEITVSTTGAGTLQGFGSAAPATENHYDNTTWETYDGYVLAIIRAGMEKGEIKVVFTADGCQSKEVILEVR